MTRVDGRTGRRALLEAVRDLRPRRPDPARRDVIPLLRLARSLLQDAERVHGGVVVIGLPSLADRLSRTHHRAQVHGVTMPVQHDHPTPADQMAALHASLRLIPRIVLVIDAAEPIVGQERRLRELLYYVRPQGAYAVLSASEATLDLLDELDRIRAEPGFEANEEGSHKATFAAAQRDPDGTVATRRVAAAVLDRVDAGRATLVRKRLHHLLKVREDAMSPEFVAGRMHGWASERVVTARTRLVPTGGCGPTAPSCRRAGSRT